MSTIAQGDCGRCRRTRGILAGIGLRCIVLEFIDIVSNTTASSSVVGAVMRIDAHVHFMVYDPREHVWVTDELSALKRNFLPAELEPLLKGAGFDGCVAVQARQLPHENEWLLDLARSHGCIRGIVGWVDLRAPDVAARLEALAAHPQIKGFRHVLIDEPDDSFLLRDDFQRGVAALGRFGFTYDLLIFPRQASAAVQLVRKLPAQWFVVDHLGLPNMRGPRCGPLA